MLEQRLCFVQLQKASTRGNQESRPAIAFLPDEGMSAEDLQRSIRDLEKIGLRVRVISPEWQGLSPGDYCALATATGPFPPDEMDAGARRIIQIMEAAGKPVICIPGVAAHDRGAEESPSPFSMKRLLADSWHNWNAIDAPRLGAALAYYTLLSLAPLLVLIVSITGLFFQRGIIQSGLVAQVQALMGPVGADIVQAILENAKLSSGVIAGAVGALLLFVGASGVFLELRDSLDTVWGVRPKYGSDLLSLVRARAFAFLVILGTGAILSALLLITAILATPVRFVLHILPAERLVAAVCTAGISLAVMTVIFALMYKMIPDIYIRWSDVWIGALVTSTLFTVGRELIGLYLATAGIGSLYAASGSLILFLAWVYYSSQIFLFGAEFTHLYAFRHGSYARPGGPRKAWHRLF